MNRTLLLRSRRKCLPPGAVALYLPVEEGRNLFRYSQQFDNAAWDKAGGTVTSNAAIAPDGSMTADQFVETVDNDSHIIYADCQVTLGTNYVGSVYVKKGTLATAPDIVQLALGGATFGTEVYANFNLSTGQVTKIGTAASATITAVPDAPGWYCCSILAVYTTAGKSLEFAIATVGNNPNGGNQAGFAGSTTSDVLLWGAQLREGTEPGEYYPTTDKQLLTDYSGNSRHGTLGSTAGADTNDPAWVTTGLVFDGTDNFVTVGTDAALNVGDGPFTLMAVVTPTSGTGGRYLLGKNAGAAMSRWEIGGAAGKWRAVHISAGGAVVKADADAAYTNGTTYLVTGVRSGNTLSLYIGTAVQAAPGTIAAAASTAAHPLTIGAGPTAADPLAGTIHAALVYPFALAPAQVAQTHAYLKGYLAKFGVVVA